MTCLIRKIDASDITQLIEIEKSATQAFLNIPELAWLADSSLLSIDDHIQLISKAYGFVSVNPENQVTGFLYAEKHVQDLYIIELDVDGAFQKQGIGRKLLEHTIDFARKYDFSSVTLTTFNDVIWNRPFYEKLGFQKLDATDLPDYLHKKILHEVECGFPRESRCAMRILI
jgi:GNAT superfamily N-acetyltransferase